jgi:predicted esterase
MKIGTLCFLALVPGIVFSQTPTAPTKTGTKSAPPAKTTAAIRATVVAKASQPYRLPPMGIEIPPAIRLRLQQQLRTLEAAARPFARDPLQADATVLLKAVRFALINGEFYTPKDVEKAKELLQLAESRLAELRADKASWTKHTGLVARGFISSIDGSPQPFGLEIPADLDLAKPVPLMVWLHGRGDKNTDMHFIADRLHKAGQFQPGGCIILHPFGRQCLGYQLAGEADVLEAVEAVKRIYKIDDKRIMLGGFSMGGAGAWHIGAHYADHWCALHAGAGFVDVKRFLNLTPDQMPPDYTQTLWGQYDVPCYVRNLFNIPVLAYSGEKDRQKLAADIMAEAYQAEGRKLHHLIGPGMGHKYHPDALKQILVWAQERMQAGQADSPNVVHWQGRTLRYPRMFWLIVSGLQMHWEDSRVDAEWEGNNLKIAVKNVTRFSIERVAQLPHKQAATAITVNGQTPVGAEPAVLEQTAMLRPDGKLDQSFRLELRGGRWQLNPPASGGAAVRKSNDLQGPIDDAFTSAFVVVPPDRASASAVREAFYRRELAYAARRWREVFRGDLPVKRAGQLTPDDLKNKNLILFGEPDTNGKIAALLGQTPIAWQDNEVRLGARSWKGESMVPLAIYPNPQHPGRYIVLNSGPTIRDKSDPNNSLQTPQLPDWAVLDVSAPATDSTPAQILDAGFFNEEWLP